MLRTLWFAQLWIRSALQWKVDHAVENYDF